MFILHLIFALLVGVVLTAIFAVASRRKGPWNSNMLFFLLVFLVAWIGGIWITPFGSTVYGVYWMPFVIAGVLMALILLATAPAQPPRSQQEAVEAAQEEVGVVRTLTAVFWVLLAVLILAVILGYFLPRAAL